MTVDLLLAGGGLANSLIALRLVETRPDLEVRLVERREGLDPGNVWSFHDSDLQPSQLSWVKPLIERSWRDHEVRFPGFTRRLTGAYHTVSGDRLARALEQELGGRVLRGRAVSQLGSGHALLDDGSRIEAACVVDGRGAEPSSALRLGFQKFVGLHVELSHPAELSRPILMDATVGQRDGYRFVYTLPFTERKLLIEDTRYSDGDELDEQEMRASIHRYAERQGWRVERVVREERGVLPIVLDGDIELFWRQTDPTVPRTGLRAVLFHPTTGYSLPEAVRLADTLAESRNLRSEELAREIRARSIELWRRGGFFRLLNRMLFEAAEPDRRYRVLARFYRLREPLIRRFYAGRPSWRDKVRTLVGRPPVPIRRALGCLFSQGAPNPNTTPERI